MCVGVGGGVGLKEEKMDNVLFLKKGNSIHNLFVKFLFRKYFTANKHKLKKMKFSLWPSAGGHSCNPFS